jgi:pyruvate-ferredoxin/flavodoxin oxidoreductase
VDFKSAEVKGAKYTIQVAPEDCTGCNLCMEICPAESKTEKGHKALNMAPVLPLREQEKMNFEFFLKLPEADRTKLKLDVKGTQFLQPLFEFSGACTACGETPYIKLVSQLYGDRAYIANATGCSSIFGGNLPTAPYTTNLDGRGPAWSNSLFEDTAEFGVGMRLAIDKINETARDFVTKLASQIGDDLATGILQADQTTEAGIAAQRERLKTLRGKLVGIGTPEARALDRIADYLVKKSVWIVGGDGWAYDIGYGGLDHVLAMGRDVNILVLDTEVYSNTGGQASKATPMGAAAKFATAGKSQHKKDLAMLAMAYGTVYVAKVALGAKDMQTVRAIQEAESYPGASIIIAYAHCINHGIDMQRGLDQQIAAVDSGYWPLLRFDPRKAAAGESPLKLDSPAPKIPLSDYIMKETRYRQVQQMNAEAFKKMAEEAQKHVIERYALYEQLANAMLPKNLVPGGAGKPKA